MLTLSCSVVVSRKVIKALGAMFSYESFGYVGETDHSHPGTRSLKKLATLISC